MVEQNWQYKKFSSQKENICLIFASFMTDTFPCLTKMSQTLRRNIESKVRTDTEMIPKNMYICFLKVICLLKVSLSSPGKFPRCLRRTTNKKFEITNHLPYTINLASSLLFGRRSLTKKFPRCPSAASASFIHSAVSWLVRRKSMELILISGE